MEGLFKPARTAMVCSFGQLENILFEGVEESVARSYRFMLDGGRVRHPMDEGGEIRWRRTRKNGRRGHL
jgi:hypothetical protein